MNLFLHGIEDFRIVRGDTLAHPAFVEGDHLMKFDVVLANPPYSIKQWDRESWASDPWGRNIYGTPPQGRADYAFWQHIIASMKARSGRCAILFPHGVLFRKEELSMREKLIAHDVVECVLGLGPNLFYNSPMEACVVICRMDKPKERRNKVLFINAVNEVTRERAQSFLTDDHIQRIVGAYQAFADEDGFARVIGNDEIGEKGCSLSIPMYVRAVTNPAITVLDDSDRHRQNSLLAAIASWQDSSKALRQSMESLFVSLQDDYLIRESSEFFAARHDRNKKEVQPAFKRAVLAAEVTSQLYEEPTFGSVKHEKIVFLCEQMLGLSESLDHHHLRQAAGPYDPRARRSTEKTFTNAKWFEIRKIDGRISYQPGEKFGAHERYYERYFSGEKQQIDSIISFFRKAKTEQCEIVATLFSAWSDFLKQGVVPSDDEIVHEVLENWHESKKRILAERWHKALGWMRKNELAPKSECQRGGNA
jgi:type I restriction enzyme M protein